MFAGLGGMGRFVRPGQKVLLKPNMLTDKEPERAVTTHPEVVRAVARMVRRAGGDPAVADSPANVVKIEKVWERTGFRAMCDEEDIPLLNLEKSGSRTLNLADGTSIAVSQPVLDADVVIGVPKVKTHLLTVYTGAVKNIYGMVPGFHKTSLHKEFPSPAAFGQLIALLHDKVRPHLSVADAVIGMEGEGPSAGTPVKLGFLAASADGAALDAVICGILGIDVRSVPYLKAMMRSGAMIDVSRIELEGGRIEDFRPASFRAPSTLIGRMMPGGLIRLLQPYIWIRPAFSEKCVSCGRCVKACPAAALTLEKGMRPALDSSRCISCCCCHETCPHNAIEMKQSPFLSFVRRGRLP